MRPLDGYPQPAGASLVSVFPHAGPASYDPVLETSPAEFPVSGGDIVEAVEAGMKLFDYVGFAMSDDGAYLVQPIPLTRSDYQQGAASATWTLRWVVIATGAEVAAEVDLSDRIVRLFARGPK